MSADNPQDSYGRMVYDKECPLCGGTTIFLEHDEYQCMSCFWTWKKLRVWNDNFPLHRVWKETYGGAARKQI